MARKKRRSWGFGAIDEHKGRYYIRWRENGVRRYGDESYERYEDARQALDQIIANLKAGRGGPPVNPKSLGTIGELGDAFLEARKANPKQHRNYVNDISRWKKHLRSFFGHFRVDELEWMHVMQFVDRKLAEKGKGRIREQTIRHCVNLLSALYADLCERHKETGVTTNPVRQIPKKKRERFKPKYDVLFPTVFHRLSVAVFHRGDVTASRFAHCGGRS